MTSSLQETIEFYFSDANLWRSPYFTAEMNARPDASFPLAKLLTCNRVKAATSSLDAIRAAIRASPHLELCCDDSAVRRRTPLPPKPSAAKQAHRTVFVDQLREGECEIDVVRQRFLPFGPVLRVELGRPRSFAFVELESELHALRAAHRSSWKAPGSPLVGWRVLTNSEYTRRVSLLRFSPAPAATTSSTSTTTTTAAAAATPVKKVTMAAAPLEPGRLLSVGGLDAAATLAQVRAPFEGVARVAYLDRNRDDPTRAVVRFFTAADRDAAVKQLADRFASLAPLSGQAETDYLANAAAQQAKRRAEIADAKKAKEAPELEPEPEPKKKRRAKRKPLKSEHVRFDDDDDEQATKKR